MDHEKLPNGVRVVADGEWAGWSAFSGVDPFEDHVGPFYFRQEQDGRVRSAMRCARAHLNGSGFMHGGAILTFADYSVFNIVQQALAGERGVTVTLNGEFVGAVSEGDLLECTGEVVRAGRSLIFARGLIVAGTAAAMNFSAVVKKLGR